MLCSLGTAAFIDHIKYIRVTSGTPFSSRLARNTHRHPITLLPGGKTTIECPIAPRNQAQAWIGRIPESLPQYLNIIIVHAHFSAFVGRSCPYSKKLRVLFTITSGRCGNFFQVHHLSFCEALQSLFVTRGTLLYLTKDGRGTSKKSCSLLTLCTTKKNKIWEGLRLLPADRRMWD